MHEVSRHRIHIGLLKRVCEFYNRMKVLLLKIHIYTPRYACVCECECVSVRVGM